MRNSLQRPTLVGLGALAAISGIAALGADAVSSELNFAGSAQLDYLFVPTNDKPREVTFDGFTTELSLKLSADVTEEVSAQVKVCFGCHGFEVGAAHVDIRPVEQLRIRAGKFVPAFGEFPDRHDPANHITSDKPLPYDMGRMLRLREWNMSVLPAPYVDNGLQLSWHDNIGDNFEYDIHAYVIGGLRANSGATDVDFIQSRSGELYYVDNNSRPSFGGRLSATIFPSDDAVISVGASAMYGTYDPDAELDYLVLGADFTLTIDRIALRAEYLMRRTEMDLGDDPASTFRYGPGADGTFDDYQLKDGFYVELTVPAADTVDLVGRFDGMRRLGNVPETSPLRSESIVLRYTLGTNWRFARGFSLKVSAEVYDFSDFDDEIGGHLGLVGVF